MTDDLGRDIDAREDLEQEAQADGTVGGADGSASLVGQAESVISQPAAGETLTIAAAAGQRYLVEFNPEQAQVSVQGNNLILHFPDGGEIVFQGLGNLVDDPNPPVFEIADQPVSGAAIFAQAAALGEAPFITAAEPTEPQGSGANEYHDDLGSLINLLTPQGVIPGTELAFGLIDLQPTEVLPGTNPPVDYDVNVTAGFFESFPFSFAPGLGFAFGQSRNFTDNDTGFDGAEGGVSELSAPLSDSLPVVDHNGTLDTAQSIPRSAFQVAPDPNLGDDSLPSVIVNGLINQANDIDYYKIELQPGETVKLDIDFGAFSGADHVDTQVFLLDSAGNVLASDDDANISNGGGGSVSGLDSYLEFTAATGGVYYAGVTAFNNDISDGGAGDNGGYDTGDYVLNISVDPTPASTGLGFSVVELLTNGGFETGDFTGWSVFDGGEGGSFFIDDASDNVTPSGHEHVGPASGDFFAVSDQEGPTVTALEQSFTVPDGATSVVLSFDMFVNNWNDTTIIAPEGLDPSVPNQHGRVEILSSPSDPFDTGGAVLATFYLGADNTLDGGEGGGTIADYTHYEFDLTEVVQPGQTYEIRFAEVDTQFFFNQGVDNVSVTATVGSPDIGAGGFLYEFQVGEAEIVTDNIHGTDVEDGVTTQFTITSLPHDASGDTVGYLLIDRGGDDVIDQIVGPGFDGVPIDVQTGDSVWYYLPKSDFAERPDSVSFNYFTTDSDGLTSLNDGPATVTIDLPDPVPTVTATDASVDEDDIVGGGQETPYVFQEPGSDTLNLGDPPFDPDGQQPTVVNGTITANFSFDDPGTISFTQATVDALNALNLTSSTVFGPSGEDHDAPLSYEISPDGLTLIGFVDVVEGSDVPVFAVSLDPASSSGTFDYTFELIGSINHPDDAGENTSVLPIKVAVTDLNGDTAVGTFNVTIVDDVPTIGIDGAEGAGASLQVWESDIQDGATPSLAALSIVIDGGEGASDHAAATVVFGADGPEVDPVLGTDPHIVTPDAAVIAAIKLDLNSIVAVDESGTGAEGGDTTVSSPNADGSLSSGLTSGGLEVFLEHPVIESGEFAGQPDPTRIVGYIMEPTGGGGEVVDIVALDQEIPEFVKVPVFEASVVLHDYVNSSPDEADINFNLFRPLDHPDAGVDNAQTGEDDLFRLNFQVTVSDDDGDTSTLPVTVDIADDGPAVFQVQPAVVDEDGLPDGIVGAADGVPGDIPDPQSAPSGDGNEATFVGNLSVLFGADGPGDISFANLDGQPVVDADGHPVTSHDEQVVYRWDTDTHTLYGVVPGADEVATLLAVNENGGTDERPVFKLELTDTGAAPGGGEAVFADGYKFTLLDQLDHPVPGPDTPGPAVEDNIFLDLPFQVTDFDGDSANGTLNVQINDDSPVVEDVTLTHDETPGVDNPNDVDPASKPAGLVAVLSTVFGGLVPHELGAAAQDIAVNYGADGPGGIALDQVVDGTDSGLVDTATGRDILLYNGPDNTIVGRVAPAVPDVSEGEGGEEVLAQVEAPAGDVAFVIHLEGSGSGADLWFVQYSAVVHDNPNDPDEANPEPVGTVTDENGRETTIPLFNDESLQVTYTATDYDGDSVQGTATITIEDDGPTILDGAEGAIHLVHDESAGQQTSGIPTPTEDNNDNDLAPAVVEPQVQAVEAWVSLLQGTTVDLTAIGGVHDTLREGVNFNAGADGLGAVRLDTSALSTGTSTGLFATADGAPISYVTVNDGLVLGVSGYTGDDANGRPEFDRVVFSLHLDTTATDLGAGEAEFTFVQYEAVVHPLPGDGSGTPSTFDEGLADGQIDGRLDIGYVVEDKDGDTVTATGDARIVVDIEDDGPTLTGQTEMGVVEEEQLPARLVDSVNVDNAGNEDTTATPDLDNDTAAPPNFDVTTLTATGSLSGLVSAGADQPASFKFTDTSDLPDLTSRGETVQYEIFEDGRVLAAFVPGRSVFLVTLESDGSYEFRLDDQLDHHPAALADDVEGFLSIDLSAAIVAADGDGDTVALGEGTFTIKVIDDIPTIDGAEGAIVTHDETPGIDLDADDTNNPLPAALAAAVALVGLAPIGSAQSAAPVVDSVKFGADGPGHLSLTNGAGALLDGADSGLARSSDDQSIFLFTNADDPHLVYGRAGADAMDAQHGDTVFVVYLDDSDKTLWVSQFDAVEHPNALNPDDTVSVSDKIFVTATDGDGDAVTADQAVTVAFQDDGPSVGDTLMVNDETYGIGDSTPSDDVNIGDLPDHVDNILGFIDEDPINVSSKPIAFDYGADGPGGIALDPVVDGTDSGLIDTATGAHIFLYNGPDDTVVGVVIPNDGVDPTGINLDEALHEYGFGVSFASAIGDPTVPTGPDNAASADLWFVQYRAVQHDNPFDPDEAGPESAPDAGGPPIVETLVSDAHLDMVGQGLSLATGGTGLDNATRSGTIDVNITGQVQSATLYWMGRDFGNDNPGADDQLLFGGNLVTADRMTGSETSIPIYLIPTENIGYAADVTNIVAAAGTGALSFNVADGDAENLDTLDGAGLLVVYTDPTDSSLQHVVVYDGLDFAYGDSSFTPPAAQVTDPVTFSYGAEDLARDGELVIFAGDAEPGRPDRIEIDGTSSYNQLDGNQGGSLDIDTFNVSIPAGSTETTVQLFSETNQYSQNGNPDSILWQVAALKMPVSGEITHTDEFVNLGYTVTDADGDTAAGTATVTIEDDGPTVHDAAVYVAVGDAALGDVTANDDFGTDGRPGLDQGVISYSYTGDEGFDVTVPAGDSGPQTFAGGALTVDPDGFYTYAAPSSVGEDMAGLVDDFTYVIQDGDGDTASGPQSIRVYDPEASVQFGDDTSESLTGTSDSDFISGGGGGDQIDGQGGNDLLFGDAGDDTLTGGGGDDLMFGDGGADTFKFSLAANEGNDTIGDVSTAQGDVLSFADVTDVQPDGNVDINDVVSSFAKTGDTVAVALQSGTTITFTDIDNSINDLNDLATHSLINGGAGV